MNKQEILDNAKKMADKYLSEFDLTGAKYDKKVVLEVLEQRTFNGKPIKVYVVDSPQQVADVLAKGFKYFKCTKEEIKKLTPHSCIWDYYQMAFWDIAYAQCPDQSDKFGKQRFYEAFKAGLGYFINLGCLAVGVMRPIAYRDPELRIHRGDGPAIVWGEDEQYWWHGVRVPDKWINDKRDEYAQEILATENAEVRRAGCEILGWEKILKILQCEIISKDEMGELLEVDLPEAPGSKFVKVVCGTGRTFILPVPQEMTTAHEAVAWSYNVKVTDYCPELRT